MHWYTAYGLTFVSDIPLPELTEAEAGHADVRVVLGVTPESIDNPTITRRIWSASDDEWLQTVEGVARYHVSGGTTITIEQWGSDRDVRAYLFGSTIGVLLHQRRLLTLHASSFLVDGKAVLVAGQSGAGKSTTLAAVIERGFTMVTDDKTVVFPDGDRLVTIPGHPTVRLHEDAITNAGRSVDGLDTLLDRGAKYLWRAPEIHDATVEVGALYLLRKGDVEEVTVSPMEGHAAFRAVLAATYRRPIVEGLGMGELHFTLAARLAESVPIFAIVRPGDGQTVDAVVDVVTAA
ncbi:MAG: hypothetical protein GY713_17345 [Actinomycetia bacterium]|nr:hypothetical protein [Actinomycetes bacterium]